VIIEPLVYGDCRGLWFSIWKCNRLDYWVHQRSHFKWILLFCDNACTTYYPKQRHPSLRSATSLSICPGETHKLLVTPADTTLLSGVWVECNIVYTLTIHQQSIYVGVEVSFQCCIMQGSPDTNTSLQNVTIYSFINIFRFECMFKLCNKPTNANQYVFITLFDIMWSILRP